MNPKPFPRVCAHRGLSGLCPENTLPAFAAAVAFGADEIELDVWASRDGELVVCHDDSVNRTTNGKGLICELTWKEIAKLDAGEKFQATSFGNNGDPYYDKFGQNGLPVNWSGTPIPRLSEVFELVGGRVGMNLHLKEAGNDGLVVRKTGELARKHKIAGDVYLAGFNDVLAAALEHAPDIERCCLDGQTDGTLVNNAIRFKCLRLQFWNPHFTDADIARAKEHGLICNVFYSDNAEEARSLFARGIDVMLTNFPNRIVPIARSFPS